ncbi:MAG: S8 family peptidase [Elusimicrobiota bacterium]|nr:S8 family peptidase [Elusimicrobiota bacterium]
MKKGLIVAVLSVLVASSASAAGKRYLVGFREGVTPQQRAAALERLGARQSDDLPEIAALVAELDETRTSFLAFEAQAAANPDVLEVQEDVYRRWLFTPSFQTLPFTGPEAALPELGRFAPSTARPQTVLPPGVDAAEIPWGISRVNAPAAWARSQGEGVKVAIIDTGIDCSHPDLRANCAGGYNAVGSGAPTDDNGHGSHVAGTVAGVLDGRGVAGVAPRARLYAVKVLDKDGAGGLVSIIKGLIWAGRNRMDVANMSLGAPMGTIFMRGALMYAASNGVAVIAAAGNDGGAVNYPAAYPEAIAVSALGPDEKLASFSSRGRQVAFTAPGVDVRSSLPGGSWAEFDGTSMATPHVTGLAALAVSRGAHGEDAVRRALNAAAVPVAGLRPHEQGAGVVDAARLVR